MRTLTLLGSFVVVGTVVAQPPDLKPSSPPTPRFSHTFLDPPELQFGCLGQSDDDEEKLAALLAKGEPHEKLAAARELWQGHSRRQAANVLKYLAGMPPGGEGFRKLQREVEASLKPEAILSELKDADRLHQGFGRILISGDYLWGTWLAFLRPHADLVPILLEGLKEQPPRDLLRQKAKGKAEFFTETLLALGQSGDLRARKPLLELLESDRYQIAGDAAQSLGYLGDADTEPQLIEALAGDNNWRQVKACGALAKFGTPQALPALEKLAKDDRYTGALNVKGMAEHAVKLIQKRNEPKKPTEE